MARRLKPVGLEFTESAPLRLVFAREVSAPPQAVFRALAEDVTGWPEWFSAVTLARPTDDGAGREVRLRGGTRMRETILTADPDEVYAYRVDETNAPGIRALVEEWRLTPSGMRRDAGAVDVRRGRGRRVPRGPAPRPGRTRPRVP